MEMGEGSVQEQGTARPLLLRLLCFVPCAKGWVGPGLIQIAFLCQQ